MAEFVGSCPICGEKLKPVDAHTVGCSDHYLVRMDVFDRLWLVCDTGHILPALLRANLLEHPSSTYPEMWIAEQKKIWDKQEKVRHEAAEHR